MSATDRRRSFVESASRKRQSLLAKVDSARQRSVSENIQHAKANIRASFIMHEPDGPPEGKLNVKKVCITMIILIIVVGGGIGAFIYLESQKNDVPIETEDT